MKKYFTSALGRTLALTGFSLALLSISCGGADHTAVPAQDGIVIARHNLDEVPNAASHVRYATITPDGRRTYLSGLFDLSASHELVGIPQNTLALVTEYHSDNWEELAEDIQPVSFVNGAHDLSFQYSGTQFISKRLAIVDMDAATGNILVRGNLPLVKKTMDACYPGEDRCHAYDEIAAKMQERMQAIDPETVFDITQYEVIDFVLHDGAGNRAELDVLMKALGRNVTFVTCGAKWLPFQGCSEWDPETLYAAVDGSKKLQGLIWWPMYPCGNKPCGDTIKIFDDYTETQVALDKFKFTQASAHLKELLTTPSPTGRKRLIYFHCIQGADRTGTLHLVYIMDNNPHLTFAQALDRAWKGKREGSDEAQLDYLGDDVKPMCKFVGTAYRYCQAKNPDNSAARCGTLEEFNQVNCKP